MKKGKYPDEGTFYVKLASLDNGLLKEIVPRGMLSIRKGLV